MNRIMLFLILFVSCGTSKENDNYIIIQKEDFTIIPLKSDKHYFEEIINPANIGIIDSKILISERHRVPEQRPRIHIINSKDWTYDKPKGKHGEGPLEITSASLFYKGENGNTF
ncbi:hypothetical protein Q4534_19195 [Cyclobacterium sp. 1_MG-2023]|uniref:hypothetical protein n=1 Tax=Cyclobacterium sp. 1_MG-2023 TaxID=3062681 RepID=UPI0026E26362|nr:hypothetical protein [Cyclobacterium sp. 1_MG-2023]MDO6439560.1 hypothetical protein [Cyclobacterium sp. 1_MG-2023]